MSRIKVTDYIAKRLKDKYSVTDFFMISGGGAMHLNDSLGRQLQYTTCHNEQAMAMTAEGYARAGERLAVVNPTSGPASLNCINGVFGQWTDSVPVLYLSGQVKFSTTIKSCPEVPLRQLGDQETDSISCVKSITKYAAMVDDAKDIKYHLDKAIYEATTGRFGPVWLDIPLNIQAALVDEDTLKEFIPPVAECEELRMEEVIAKLVKSERPLIIAGHGLRIAKEVNNLQKLTETTGIPVVSTFNGFDVIPDSNPSYMGRIGTLGQRAGNFILQSADLVLCLGTRNNLRQVSYNYENYAKKC